MLDTSIKKEQSPQLFNQFQEKNNSATSKMRSLTESPININYNTNEQNTIICIQMQQSKPLFGYDEFVLISKQKQTSLKLQKINQNIHGQKINNKSRMNEEDQKLLKQLNYNSNNYKNIVINLQNKIKSLQSQYKNLLKNKQKSKQLPISISFKKTISFTINDQLNNNHLNINKLQKHQSLKYTQKIPNNSTINLFKLKLSKVYQYKFKSLNQVQQRIEEGQSQLMKICQQNYNQQKNKYISQRPNMIKSKNLDQHLKQFSSGQVQNLLMGDDSYVSVEQKVQQLQKDKQQQNIKHVSQINFQNILIPSTISQSEKGISSFHQIHNNLSSFNLPFISLSKANTSILKQSYQSLPYQKIVKIMSLQKFQQKLSFKPKHYPSSLATEKQIKLYGKRIFRLLNGIIQQKGIKIQQNQQQKVQKFIDNKAKIQNQMQYEVNQQYVVYYIKGNTNFIVICYFNHTIYIGEYVTHGPKQQIVRQGYGIQYRQNKYIYQGEFYSDKKTWIWFYKKFRKKFIYIFWLFFRWFYGWKWKINELKRINIYRIIQNRSKRWFRQNNIQLIKEYILLR